MTTATRALVKAIHQNSIKAGRDESAAPWVKDFIAESCMVCKGEFTVVNRRHHCRKCGRVVCGSCTTHRMAVKEGQEKAVRVCDPCFIASLPNEGKSSVKDLTMVGSVPPPKASHASPATVPVATTKVAEPSVSVDGRSSSIGNVGD